jgi:diacylglycerol kinase (ATP)
LSSFGPHARKLATDPVGFASLPPRITGAEPRRHPFRVALISNPTSGRNARRGLLAGIHDLLRAHPDVAHFEERTFGGIAAATRRAVDDGAEIVAVNGGDGSVQTVLTSIMTAATTHLPLIAVLPGGTTNTTARNVGYARRPLQGLERLLAAATRGDLAGRIEPRAVLRADLEDGPQYAMMFGAGAVYHGIVFARAQLATHGVRGQLGAGVALATFLARILSGQAGTMFPPIAASLRLDGVDLPAASYVGILASTMDRQFLGVSPYWGVGPGPLRVSAMRERPRHLARAVLPALRGVPSPWLQPEHGYRSHNVDELTIGFAGGFTLDGELFEPAARARRLVLTARQVGYFLRGDA